MSDQERRRSRCGNGYSHEYVMSSAGSRQADMPDSRMCGAETSGRRTKGPHRRALRLCRRSEIVPRGNDSSCRLSPRALRLRGQDRLRRTSARRKARVSSSRRRCAAALGVSADVMAGGAAGLLGAALGSQLAHLAGTGRAWPGVQICMISSADSHPSSGWPATVQAPHSPPEERPHTPGAGPTSHVGQIS